MVQWWQADWAIFFISGNALLFAFNMLPIWPLDGGKILQCFMCRSLPYLKTIEYTTIISLLLSNFLLIIACFRSPPHLNLLVLALYLLFANITAYRRAPYQFLRFLLSKFHGEKERTEETVTIAPGMKVKDVVKMLKKGRFLRFYIAGTGYQFSEDELLAVFFGEKLMHATVFDVFGVK
jgi:stage IV sporulation protein FB